MSNVRVPVYGTVGKSINFDPQAGARAEAAIAALAAQISAGIGGNIRHSALQGLQVGDDHPQYAGSMFPESISGLWDFTTIPLIQGDTLAEYIEDVVGGSFFDFLQDTTSVVWTYHETANELEANVPPEFVQDTVGAMLTDSTSIDFTYSDVAGTFTASTINANPTGTIGLSAVNGSAATPMRSDAAPALSQAIAPVWTGKHQFTNARTLFFASQYVANVPSLTEAQLDDFAAISTMSEHSFRCIRSSSPNFTGVAWGAAMSGANAAAVNGTILATFRGDGYEGAGDIGGHETGGSIQVVASETWSSTAHGAGLAFFVNPNGTATLVEALTLTNGGDLRINRDSAEIQLGAGQDLRFYHDGTNSYINNGTGTLVVEGATVSGRAATFTSWSTPNISLANLSAITGSGTPTTIFERSLKVVRSTSPVFNGIAWGAALSGSQAAATTGTILFALRGSGYFDTSGVGNFYDGAEIQVTASENWSTTNKGAQIDFTTTPLASTAQATAARFDGSTTAGDTRFMVYDVDNGTLERVTVGAANSGGAGFKLLRIPN